MLYKSVINFEDELGEHPSGIITPHYLLINTFDTNCATVSNRYNLRILWQHGADLQSAVSALSADSSVLPPHPPHGLKVLSQNSRYNITLVEDANASAKRGSVTVE